MKSSPHHDGPSSSAASVPAGGAFREKAAGDAAYWPVFNLDRKNPAAKDEFEHLPPEQLADDILQKELRIAEIMREIKDLLGRKP